MIVYKERSISMNSIVGFKLKHIRLNRGWTQAFVAELTGLSIRSISRLENGCGASKSTIQKLCSLYKIDVHSLYEATEPIRDAKVDLLSEETLSSILHRNSLLEDLQREVVLQFTATIGKTAVMTRDDVEAIVNENISMKKNFTLTDVITACMAVNSQTIQNIANTAIA